MLSSPNTETFFPISANHCLRISPGDPELKTVEASPSHVMEIDLRIYGWADCYVYGGSQNDVCAVRRALKTSKRKYALPPTPARFATLLQRDPEDGRLAQSHLARGWPAYLTALGENGIPEQLDYMVVGEDGTAVEIGISSEKLVEERARKAGGYTEGEPMPGGVNIKSVSPLSVLPTRS